MSTTAGATGRMSAIPGTSERILQQHPLPRWFDAFQSTFYLSFMLIAEMVICAIMMSYGVVLNLNDPSSWSWYQWVMVVVMLLTGSVMGGMIIRCSVASFTFYMTGHPILGTINLGGMAFFGMFEFWAGLVERAGNVPMTQPDTLALGLLQTAIHVTSTVVAPTVFLIAAAPAVAGMLWGFSTTKAPQKSASELTEENARKLEMQRFKNAKRRLQAEGWAGAARAGAAALAVRQASPFDAQSHDLSDNNPGGDGGPSGTPLPPESEREDGAFRVRKDGASRRSLSVLRQGGGIPRDRVDKDLLARWVHENFDVTISEREALAFLKAQPGVRPERGVHGTPLTAPKAATFAAAKRKWGRSPAGHLTAN